MSTHTATLEKEVTDALCTLGRRSNRRRKAGGGGTWAKMGGARGCASRRRLAHLPVSGGLSVNRGRAVANR